MIISVLRYKLKTSAVLDVLLCAAGFAGLYASVALFPLSLVRGILGLGALFVLPGVVLTLLLFPGREAMGFWERLSLGVGLGVVMLTFVALVDTLAPWTLGQTSILTMMGLLVVAATLSVWFRHKTQDIFAGLRVLRRETFTSFRLAPKQLAPLLMRSYVLKTILLLAVLAFGYWLTFVPHRDYPFPLHVDEWFHLTYFKAIQLEDSVLISNVPPYDFPDPASTGIEPGNGDLEPAFHLLWAGFQAATDIPWFTLFRFVPGAIFVFTLVAIYALASRRGYGLEAAILASLMPTTLSVLGPSLLVPVSIGLMLLSLGLLLVLYHRTFAGYLSLFLLMSFLAFAHFPTAVTLGVISLPFLAFNLLKNRRETLVVGAILLLTLAAALPLLLKVVPDIGGSLFQTVGLPVYLPYLPEYLRIWGYPFVALFIAGMVLLIIRWEKVGISLVVASLLLLLHNYSFTSWDLGLQILYHRGPLYLTFLASLVGGYALWFLRSGALRLLATYTPKLTNTLRITLSIVPLAVIIGLTFADTVERRLDEPFYHMIDDHDSSAFLWIGENLSDCHRKAILDPWKATAFMAISGRDAYARIHHAPGEDARQAYAFLGEGASDTGFLKQNQISIIYSQQPVNNQDLLQVTDRTYILPEALCQ